MCYLKMFYITFLKNEKKQKNYKEKSENRKKRKPKILIFSKLEKNRILKNNIFLKIKKEKN